MQHLHFLAPASLSCVSAPSARPRCQGWRWSGSDQGLLWRPDSQTEPLSSCSLYLSEPTSTADRAAAPEQLWLFSSWIITCLDGEMQSDTSHAAPVFIYTANRSQKSCMRTKQVSLITNSQITPSSHEHRADAKEKNTKRMMRSLNYALYIHAKKNL